MSNNAHIDNLDLVYDWISEADLPAAHKMEVEGYPADEAATLDTFRQRQAWAPKLFLATYDPKGKSSRDTPSPHGTLVGYVCSTLSRAPTLTHETMSTHDAAGTSVCIHSVCVARAYRRRGVGVRLLEEYVARLQQQREEEGSAVSYERVLLIAHEELREFYTKAGLEWVGKSPVRHGDREWFEMRKMLGVS